MRLDRVAPAVLSLLLFGGLSGRQAAVPPVPDPWTLDPVLGAGALTPTADEASLRRAFGDSAVAVESVGLGEGVEVTGLVLFPRDSLRRLAIVWHDSVGRRAPARLILHGSKSRWRLSAGISLGTSLATLERLNGRPFVLAGFGWDYSGVVYDWRGGRLEPLKGRVYLYLETHAPIDSPAAARLVGEREFESDNPDMRTVAPTVGTIFIDW